VAGKFGNSRNAAVLFGKKAAAEIPERDFEANQKKTTAAMQSRTIRPKSFFMRWKYWKVGKGEKN
jgi:hypothetical protein